MNHKRLIVMMLIFLVSFANCKRNQEDLTPLAIALWLCSQSPKTPFIETLPDEVRSSVLWFSTFEGNDFSEWEDQGTGTTYAGGGIFVTDESNTGYGIISDQKNTGSRAAYTELRNAMTPGSNKAVRLMRWTDKPWNEEGDYFPDSAYYSVFVYLPYSYNPKKPPDNDPYGDGGWWNTFQFKSDNNAGSQPVVSLDLYNQGGKMYYGLVIKDYTDDNSSDHTQSYILQDNPLELQPGRWNHLEAFYLKRKDYTGEVKVWQNGNLILQASNVRTQLPPGETTDWGIGNYTDYIEGGSQNGTARIYFDDAIVSTKPVHNFAVF